MVSARVEQAAAEARDRVVARLFLSSLSHRAGGLFFSLTLAPKEKKKQKSKNGGGYKVLLLALSFLFCPCLDFPRVCVRCNQLSSRRAQRSDANVVAAGCVCEGVAGFNHGHGCGISGGKGSCPGGQSTGHRMSGRPSVSELFCSRLDAPTSRRSTISTPTDDQQMQAATPTELCFAPPVACARARTSRGKRRRALELDVPVDLFFDGHGHGHRAAVVSPAARQRRTKGGH